MALTLARLAGKSARNLCPLQRTVSIETLLSISIKCCYLQFVSLGSIYFRILLFVSFCVYRMLSDGRNKLYNIIRVSSVKELCFCS